MFDPSSRYAKCGIATLSVTDPDGTAREIRYVKRRFIPLTEGMTVIVEHLVSQGERLDNITAQYLGDPTQFWRICDANEVMNPDELEEIGISIKIAMPTM
jgi:nucleoid-associated protein YgaU